MTGESGDPHHELSDVAEQARLHGKPASTLKEEFDSEEALVEFLEGGNSPSDIDGVGRKTSNKLLHWFEEEHPAAHRRMRENDESVFTDFEAYVEAETDDGSPVWGAYCPQPDCGQINHFVGDPSGFAGRPYACEHCSWVSLMDERVRNLEVPA